MQAEAASDLFGQGRRLGRGSPVEHSMRAVVELRNDRIESSWGNTDTSAFLCRYLRSSRFGVLVGAALPGMVWVAEGHRHRQRSSDHRMVSDLPARSQVGDRRRCAGSRLRIPRAPRHPPRRAVHRGTGVHAERSARPDPRPARRGRGRRRGTGRRAPDELASYCLHALTAAAVSDRRQPCDGWWWSPRPNCGPPRPHPDNS